MKFTAYLIDDESLARARVKKLLAAYAHQIDLIGEVDTGYAAIEAIEKFRPDVLFLDIQLLDMTGFELLKQLSYQPLVIFTTAYEKYAIQAFESYSIDYLVKPFDVDRFKKAMEKLQKFGQQKPNTDFQALEALLFQQNKQKPSFSLPVKIGNKILLIDYEDISYLKAADKYVTIVLKNGKTYLHEQSLSRLQENLPTHFIRVHRSYIVNQYFIREVRKYFKGKLILKLEDQAQTAITTGEKYSGMMRSVLGL